MRHGYYVNGRHYSPALRSQAIARANFLALEYGRAVAVMLVDPDDGRRIIHTARADLENSMRGTLLAVL